MLFKWEVFGVEISPGTTSGTTGTSRDLARVPGDVGDDMSSPSSPMSFPDCWGRHRGQHVIPDVPRRSGRLPDLPNVVPVIPDVFPSLPDLSNVVPVVPDVVPIIPDVFPSLPDLPNVIPILLDVLPNIPKCLLQHLRRDTEDMSSPTSQAKTGKT